MKRIAFTLFLILLLCGCTGQSASSQYVGGSSTADTEETSPEYEKYNVLSYEKTGKNDWKITNNADYPLSLPCLSIAYYDEEGTIVESYLCTVGASLLPDQSAYGDVLEPTVDYVDAEVVSYCYWIPETSSESGNKIEVNVDVITKTIRIVE